LTVRTAVTATMMITTEMSAAMSPIFDGGRADFNLQCAAIR
jgi:hypothetical protein